MDATKALIVYLKLRDRRERLTRLPASTKAVKRETFTETELQQLTLAETELNRLRGARAIELLLSNKSAVLGYITK